MENTIPWALRWFNQYVIDDKEDIRKICAVVDKMASEKLDIAIANNGGHMEVYAAVFHGILTAIMEYMRSKQKEGYKQFTIELGNSLNFGYDNDDDENNEKVGNFMPILEYIGTSTHPQRPRDTGVSNTNTIAAAAMNWKSANMKKTTSHYQAIQEIAYKILSKSYRVQLPTSELIFPIFCLFLDNMAAVLKYKYNELQGTGVSQVSMNVVGMFKATYSFDVINNEEIIQYQAFPAIKLGMKSDTMSHTE